MSSLTTQLIEEIEYGVDTPELAARQLRSAALELLAEVNRLEREWPAAFLAGEGREWHIARYEASSLSRPPEETGQ